jgi:hypothetical protein
MKIKPIFFLMLCLITNELKAQDSLVLSKMTEGKENQKIFRFDEELYAYLHRNNYFGDNFLSDAHQTTFGFGLELIPFKIYRFGIGTNFEKSYHKVTNIAMAGNIKSTNSNTYQLNLIYNHNLNEHFRLDPYVGIGNIDLIQRSPGQKYGRQNGTTWSIGSNLLYKFENNISVFAGLAYRSAKMNVKTSEEFRPYFSEIKGFQFKFGIVFH